MSESGTGPQIWVDADACPGPIKEILFRAAQRTGIALTLVANHSMRIPAAKHIRMLRVASGFDKADDEITARAQAGDLVISADIPLAAELIGLGVAVVSPRGEAFTADTIKAKLTMRDFMETMRASGVEMHGGPAALNQNDRKQFAAQLDRWLQQRR